MNELLRGIRVESEHKSTIDWIKRYQKRYKKLPSNREIYKHIAKNHLTENPRYYSKLIKAKL